MNHKRKNLSHSDASSKLTSTSLVKIQNGLMERFLNGDTDPITLDQIIQEFQLNIAPFEKPSLTKELSAYPRIHASLPDNIYRFAYKPPLELKGGKSALLRLLKTRHEQCQDAVSVEDIQASMLRKYKADKIIEDLIKEGQIVKIKNRMKSEMLYYNDQTYKLDIHPTFHELWRKFSFQDVDTTRMHDSLHAQGHSTLSTETPQPTHLAKKRLKRLKQNANTVKINNHVLDQLQQYEPPSN